MLGLFHALRSKARSQSHIATIDAAKAAPPPSPLAPIDLTDSAQVAGVMDISARIGELLLASGTSNNDTKTQIHAVCSAYGLHYVHVDITFNTITIFTHIGTHRRQPVNVFRVVRGLTTDFSKLSEVDRLIRSIQGGATPPEVAEKILDELYAKPATYKQSTSILGWGVMGGTVSVMLGGDAIVGLTSFFVSMLIMTVNYWLQKKNLPYFFQNVVGGVLATMPAAVMYASTAHFGVRISPSQIIASGIIVLLAGLTLVQSLQDGITGAPVTASARFFETLLYTGAIVGGVGLGIQLSATLGMALPALESVAPPNFQSALVRVIFGAIATGGFALACYAEKSSVWLSGITAASGSFFYYYVLSPLGTSGVTAAAVAAVVIGLAGGLLARRFQIPPVITAIAGITPLLPGLSVYRGMYAALHEQMLVGFTNLAVALATACALAAGVVLGEFIARRLRRPPRINAYRAFQAARRYSFQQASRAKRAQARLTGSRRWTKRSASEPGGVE